MHRDKKQTPYKQAGRKTLKFQQTQRPGVGRNGNLKPLGAPDSEGALSASQALLHRSLLGAYEKDRGEQRKPTWDLLFGKYAVNPTFQNFFLHWRKGFDDWRRKKKPLIPPQTQAKEIETKRISLWPNQEPWRLPPGGSGAGNSPPPGTIVDTQQNVAAQRGRSENTKVKPAFKAERRGACSKPGKARGAEIRPYGSPWAPYRVQATAIYTAGVQITEVIAKGLQPAELSRDSQTLKMEQRHRKLSSSRSPHRERTAAARQRRDSRPQCMRVATATATSKCDLASDQAYLTHHDSDLAEKGARPFWA